VKKGKGREIALSLAIVWNGICYRKKKAGKGNDGALQGVQSFFGERKGEEEPLAAFSL